MANSSFRSNRAIGLSGMTLVEVILAVFMLVMFTGVFASVLEVVGSYLGVINGNSLRSSLGWQADRSIMEIFFDDAENYFSGVSKTQIDEYIQGGCVVNPYLEWNIPSSESVALIGEYFFCLRAAPSMPEQLSVAAGDGESALPGFYVVQALPAKLVSSSSGSSPVQGALPMRRLFCRPKPFC